MKIKGTALYDVFRVSVHAIISFYVSKKSGKLSFSIRFALNLINHPSKRWALIRVEGAN